MTMEELITEYKKLVALDMEASREGRDTSLLSLLAQRAQALGIGMFAGPNEGQVEFDGYHPLQPVSA